MAQELELPSWFAAGFLGLQFPWLLVNLIDAHYFRFAGRRSSLGVLKLRAGAADQTGQLLLQYWFIPLVALAGGITIYFAVRRVAASNCVSRRLGWKAWCALGLIVIGLCVLSIRGGIQSKPLSPTHAYSFSSVDLGDLALNTPFVMTSTMSAVSVPVVHFYRRQGEVDTLIGHDRAAVPHFPPS